MEANGRSVPRFRVRLRAGEVTILAVDDNEGFRHVLRDVIAAAPGFVLVGDARSGEEAIRAVDLLFPQLVLMDLKMPGMGGIAAAQHIVERHSAVAVVLISVDDPSLDPEVVALGNAVSCALKRDLRPQKLSELWEMQHS